MENFLKNNWFKIIIASIILLCGLALFLYLQSQQKEAQQKQFLESSIKCNQDGSKFFDDYTSKTALYNIKQPLVDPITADVGLNNLTHIYSHMYYKFNDPVYHFNKQLNACLVLISYDGSTHAHNNGQNLVSVFDSHHEEIVDIYANKTLLSTEGYGVDVNKFNEQKNILMNQ